MTAAVVRQRRAWVHCSAGECAAAGVDGVPHQHTGSTALQQLLMQSFTAGAPAPLRSAHHAFLLSHRLLPLHRVNAYKAEWDKLKEAQPVRPGVKRPPVFPSMDWSKQPFGWVGCNARCTYEMVA